MISTNELLEFLQNEKENSSNEFKTYGNVALTILPLATTTLFGISWLIEDSPNESLKIYAPFLCMFFLALLMIFALLQYSSGLSRRIYEKSINQLLKGEFCIRYKDLHNVMFDHRYKSKFSPEMNIMNLVIYGLIFIFYIKSSYDALKLLKGGNFNWNYYAYLFALIVIPITSFLSFNLLIRKFNKVSKVKERQVLLSIKEFKKRLKK